MAHGHDNGLPWEWDSVLLLAHPSVPSISLECDDSTCGPEETRCSVPGECSHSHHHNAHRKHNPMHENSYVRETSSADLIQTDSLSSGSLQQEANQEYRDPRLDCPNFLAGRVPCACTDNDDDDSGFSRKRSKPVPRCQVASCGAELGHLKGYHQRHRVCLRCAHATRVVLRNQPHRYCQQCGKFHRICDFDEGKRSCRRKLERHNNRRRRKASEFEDTLPPLDSGDIDLRGDSSPTDDLSISPELNLPNEGEQKSPGTDRATLEGEEKLQAEDSPSKEESSVAANVPVLATIRMDSIAEMPLPAFKPPNAKYMAENVTTFDPSTNSQTSPVLQLELEKADLLAECTPLVREAHQGSPPTLCCDAFPGHNSALTESEATAQAVTGHDEESLLALLMEDTSTVEDSGLSHNGDAHLLHLLQSSAAPIRLSKQTTYSSPHPTGRISFKLYDWNPGDFPRHLRQQVLEWLSNMPVDLEGYIRSGCTILTLFIAMPPSMWEKLNADWGSSVVSLIKAQDGLSRFWNSGYLIARMGHQLVHINNGEPICVLCEGSDNVPELQRVHPICLVAGCEAAVEIYGNRLLQPKSRLLVSFGGKYIKSEECRSQFTTAGAGEEDRLNAGDSDEILRVTLPVLDPNKFGTAFIEVEHMTGVSNFIPLLIAERKVVDEIQTLEKEIDSASTFRCSPVGNSNFQGLSRREVEEVLIDLGWVLRSYSLYKFEAAYEAQILGQDIERLQRILFLGIKRGWFTVVQRVLQVAKTGQLMEKIGVLSNGLSALHVALLHHQVGMVQHLAFCVDSLGMSGHCGGKFWWNVDFPGPRGLTALHIIALQMGAEGLHNGLLLNDEKNAFLWKFVKDHLGKAPQDYAERKLRQSISSFKTETCAFVPSEEEQCAGQGIKEGFKETEYHNVGVPFTNDSETRMFLPNLGYLAAKSTGWKLVKRTDDIETQGILVKPSMRFGCSVGMLRMYICRVSKRRPLYVGGVSALLVCAGLCVMLQHPNQVIELSMSLRRCLWGIDDGPL